MHGCPPVGGTGSIPADSLPHPTMNSLLADSVKSIDHVAIAVHDLEEAIASYERMGFSVAERIDARGSASGMISAVLVAGPVKFVLLQGTEEASQVSRFVREFGPGPQHIALAVEDCEAVCADLEARGLEFNTSLIAGPELTQRFSARCPNSGVMFEFIERREGQQGFSRDSVKSLFRELESKSLF